MGMGEVEGSMPTFALFVETSVAMNNGQVLRGDVASPCRGPREEGHGWSRWSAGGHP